MKEPFSEFSFGFAYTFELANLWQNKILTRAPLLPSLVEEGKDGGGYDVALKTGGFLYCAQFKLSKHLKTSRASEAKKGYSTPYYRFPVQRNQSDNQHERLLKLEAPPDTLVEYVAPLFTDRKDLDHHFKKDDLRSQVIRVKPSVIGELPGEGRHCVVCDEAGGNRMRFSEPIELESPSDWGEITEDGFAHRPSTTTDSVGETASQDQRRPTTIYTQLAEFTEKVVMYALETPTLTYQEFYSDDDVPDPRFYLMNFDSNPVGIAQAVSRILLGAELFVFSDGEERA